MPLWVWLFVVGTLAATVGLPVVVSAYVVGYVLPAHVVCVVVALALAAFTWPGGYTSPRRWQGRTARPDV